MTSPETANIFILGATGYIGGSFVSVLLDSTHPPHRLTALIRSNDKLKTFENLSTNHTNCIGVQGSYEDHHLLERLASEHEVVISAADADDEGMMTAILKGMKKRHGKTGKAGVLIQVSGTGTIVDDSRGMFEGKDVRSDGFLWASTDPWCRSTPTCLLRHPLIHIPRPSTSCQMTLSTVLSTCSSKLPTRRDTPERISYYQAPYGDLQTT